QILVKGKGSILFHDNVRPQVASTTVQKLHQLGIEVPLNSPNLSPINFHLFSTHSTISLRKNDFFLSEIPIHRKLRKFSQQEISNHIEATFLQSI
ncbi:Histone-lysine N-methyltransferase SETMAR, partial [Habropoda laboriosa]